MTRLAETNVKTARDEELAEVVADVVGLEVEEVQARIEEAHGRTRLDTLFAEEWPREAADFEGKSAAWARDHGLDEELSAITGLTARTIRGRLKKADGRTHVQNVFADDWPEEEEEDEDEAEEEASGQLGLKMDTKPKAEPKPKKAGGKKKAGKKASDTADKVQVGLSGSLGFEQQLWTSADVLRNNMDPSEYKHVVLGLLFLKYIADAFDERREELRASLDDPDSDNYMDPSAPEEKRAEWLESLLEDRDEYTAERLSEMKCEIRGRVG